jgi:hypothetical protein
VLELLRRLSFLFLANVSNIFFLAARFQLFPSDVPVSNLNTLEGREGKISDFGHVLLPSGFQVSKNRRSCCHVSRVNSSTVLGVLVRIITNRMLCSLT